MSDRAGRGGDRRLIFGLLGEKLAHSYSPEIHAMLGKYSYSLFEVQRKELKDFLLKGDFDGINVTIPYKKDVIPYLNYLSPLAEKIGAVNTIVRDRDGFLGGFNTDYLGFTYMLSRLKIDVRGKKALILGTGGAALTVRNVLCDLDTAKIVNISRHGENNYKNLDLHADADLIVNATPLGMYPNVKEKPIDLSAFHRCLGVLDLIYNPARTSLILQAIDLGIPWENGLSMLISQAAASSQLFTKKKITQERIKKIYDALFMKMQNVILIGMPGCGKTTVGKELSVLTGRSFYDCDIVFNKKYGISAEMCIKKQGEERFRTMESGLLEELCTKSGSIIATGGGCVTVGSNRGTLRRNGVCVWLGRDIRLLSTKKRPLSVSEGLQAMYERRAPLYASFSDLYVENIGKPAKTALDIKNRLRI